MIPRLDFQLKNCSYPTWYETTQMALDLEIMLPGKCLLSPVEDSESILMEIFFCRAEGYTSEELVLDFYAGNETDVKICGVYITNISDGLRDVQMRKDSIVRNAIYNKTALKNKYDGKVTLNFKNVSSEEDSDIRLNFLLEFPSQKCPEQPCNIDSATFLAMMTSPGDASHPTKNFTLKVNMDKNQQDLYEVAPLCVKPDALGPGFFVVPESTQVSAGGTFQFQAGFFVVPESTQVSAGGTFQFQAVLKIHPGSVGHFSITVNASDKEGGKIGFCGIESADGSHNPFSCTQPLSVLPNQTHTGSITWDAFKPSHSYTLDLGLLSNIRGNAGTHRGNSYRRGSPELMTMATPSLDPINTMDQVIQRTFNLSSDHAYSDVSLKILDTHDSILFLFNVTANATVTFRNVPCSTATITEDRRGIRGIEELDSITWVLPFLVPMLNNMNAWFRLHSGKPKAISLSLKSLQPFLGVENITVEMTLIFTLKERPEEPMARLYLGRRSGPDWYETTQASLVLDIKFPGPSRGEAGKIHANLSSPGGWIPVKDLNVSLVPVGEPPARLYSFANKELEPPDPKPVVAVVGPSDAVEGEEFEVKVFVKLHPGSVGSYKLRVRESEGRAPQLGICTLEKLALNFTCADGLLQNLIAVYHPKENGSKVSAEMNLGLISSIESENVTNEPSLDRGSILFRVKGVSFMNTKQVDLKIELEYGSESIAASAQFSVNSATLKTTENWSPRNAAIQELNGNMTILRYNIILSANSSYDNVTFFLSIPPCKKEECMGYQVTDVKAILHDHTLCVDSSFATPLLPRVGRSFYPPRQVSFGCGYSTKNLTVLVLHEDDRPQIELCKMALTQHGSEIDFKNVSGNPVLSKTSNKNFTNMGVMTLTNISSKDSFTKENDVDHSLLINVFAGFPKQDSAGSKTVTRLRAIVKVEESLIFDDYLELSLFNIKSDAKPFYEIVEGESGQIYGNPPKIMPSEMTAKQAASADPVPALQRFNITDYVLTVEITAYFLLFKGPSRGEAGKIHANLSSPGGWIPVKDLNVSLVPLGEAPAGLYSFANKELEPPDPKPVVAVVSPSDAVEGEEFQVKVFVKLHPGSVGSYKLRVRESEGRAPQLGICTLEKLALNFTCADGLLQNLIAVYHPKENGSKVSAEMNLGLLSSIESENVTNEPSLDRGSILFRVKGVPFMNTKQVDLKIELEYGSKSIPASAQFSVNSATLKTTENWSPRNAAIQELNGNMTTLQYNIILSANSSYDNVTFFLSIPPCAKEECMGYQVTDVKAILHDHTLCVDSSFATPLLPRVGRSFYPPRQVSFGWGYSTKNLTLLVLHEDDRPQIELCKMALTQHGSEINFKNVSGNPVLSKTSNKNFTNMGVMTLTNISSKDSFTKENDVDHSLLINVFAGFPKQDSTGSKNVTRLRAIVKVEESLIFDDYLELSLFNIKSDAKPFYEIVEGELGQIYGNPPKIMPSEMAAKQGDYFSGEITLQLQMGTIGTYLATVRIPDVERGLKICGLRIKGASSNLPCTEPVLKPLEATYHPNASRPHFTESVVDLGLIATTGPEYKSSEVLGAIHLEVLGMCTLDASEQEQFSVEVRYGAENVSVSSNISIARLDSSQMDALGMRGGMKDLDGNNTYHPGYTKLLSITITLPPGKLYPKLAVALWDPLPGVEDYSLCCPSARIIHPNVPCRRETLSENLGVFASEEVNGITERKELVLNFEEIRTYSGNGSNPQILAEIAMNVKENISDMIQTVMTQNLSSTDVPPALKLPVGVGLPKVEIDHSLFLFPAERDWIVMNITIPNGATLQPVVTVQSPASQGRAQVTMHRVQVLHIGHNVPFVEANMEYVFYSSPNITERVQKDVAKIQFGFVRNIGRTHRIGIVSPDDDKIAIAVEVMLTDHPRNVHGEEFNVTIEANFGMSLFNDTIQPIWVRRSGYERPDIKSALQISEIQGRPFAKNSLVQLKATVRHSNTSNREVNNATVRFILPPYLTPDLKVTASKDIVQVLTPNGVVDVMFKHLVFLDELEVYMNITVNPNGTPTPKGRDGRVNATILGRIVGSMDAQQGGGVKWPEESDKLFLCGKTGFAMMEVRETMTLRYGIVCEDTPLGMRSKAIKDCQIGASRALNEASAPRFARIGQTGVWSPGIVPEDNTQPYLQVNFGNFTRVTGVEIEKHLYARFRTIENFTLQKSRDLKTFTDHENGSFAVSSRYELKTPLEARAIRLIIVSASRPEEKENVQIGVQLEFYGCPLSFDIPDGCEYPPPPTQMTDTGSWKHYVEHKGTGSVFFCDAFDDVLHGRRKDLERQAERKTLPLYVNELLGYDESFGRILARDSERRSYLSSKDGTLWFVITKEEYDSAASSSDFHPATPVPASGRKPPSIPRPDHFPPWAGDTDGLHHEGNIAVEWSVCCH
ncbi:unnamed protein product [Darwinula stevensoni]|uniref:F5/8 type C domain-containing protein n=1 Tax=Darwinula stevensoni TaxID=69355 RepID=A0A7R9AEW3_9CRUS|nr:unnamed protein product [Darwinula stevensoni]CAG0902719.1 unnamed protein product [Darwinula stevensoni]